MSADQWSMSPVQNNARLLPGWYPDPSGRSQLRYFDGSQWTTHVAGYAAC